LTTLFASNRFQHWKIQAYRPTETTKLLDLKIPDILITGLAWNWEPRKYLRDAYRSFLLIKTTRFIEYYPANLSYKSLELNRWHTQLLLTRLIKFPIKKPFHSILSINTIKDLTLGDVGRRKTKKKKKREGRNKPGEMLINKTRASQKRPLLSRSSVFLRLARSLFRHGDDVPLDPSVNFASVFRVTSAWCPRRQNGVDLPRLIRRDFFHFFTVRRRCSFSHCNASSIVESLNDSR